MNIGEIEMHKKQAKEQQYNADQAISKVASVNFAELYLIVKFHVDNIEHIKNNISVDEICDLYISFIRKIKIHVQHFTELPSILESIATEMKEVRDSRLTNAAVHLYGKEKALAETMVCLKEILQTLEKHRNVQGYIRHLNDIVSSTPYDKQIMHVSDMLYDLYSIFIMHREFFNGDLSRTPQIIKSAYERYIRMVKIAIDGVLMGMCERYYKNKNMVRFIKHMATLVKEMNFSQDARNTLDILNTICLPLQVIAKHAEKNKLHIHYQITMNSKTNVVVECEQKETNEVVKKSEFADIYAQLDRKLAHFYNKNSSDSVFGKDVRDRQDDNDSKLFEKSLEQDIRYLHHNNDESSDNDDRNKSFGNDESFDNYDRNKSFDNDESSDDDDRNKSFDNNDSFDINISNNRTFGGYSQYSSTPDVSPIKKLNPYITSPFATPSPVKRFNIDIFGGKNCNNQSNTRKFTKSSAKTTTNTNVLNSYSKTINHHGNGSTYNGPVYNITYMNSYQLTNTKPTVTIKELPHTTKKKEKNIKVTSTYYKPKLVLQRQIKQKQNKTQYNWTNVFGNENRNVVTQPQQSNILKLQYMREDEEKNQTNRNVQYGQRKKEVNKVEVKQYTRESDLFSTCSSVMNSPKKQDSFFDDEDVNNDSKVNDSFFNDSLDESLNNSMLDMNLGNNFALSNVEGALLQQINFFIGFYGKIESKKAVIQIKKLMTELLNLFGSGSKTLSAYTMGEVENSLNTNSLVGVTRLLLLIKQHNEIQNDQKSSKILLGIDQLLNKCKRISMANNSARNTKKNGNIYFNSGGRVTAINGSSGGSKVFEQSTYEV